MLTFVIALLLASAVVTFILMKKGKIADANNNSIPDVIEDKVEAVKEVVKKASKPKANKPKVEAPKPAAKMDAPKPTINKKPVKKNK